MSNQLRLGIPDGSPRKRPAELFRNAGFNVTFASRSYYPAIDDPEIHCTLIAQEMARYVQDGSLDCGLTGHDWMLENEAKVTQLAELVFSKVSRRPVRWVFAVPNDSPIKTVHDLQGKRIATELVGVTKLVGRPWRHCSCRIQLGSHRGQAAALRRRHRGCHRDRQFAQGQQPAHRRRTAPEHDPFHRQRVGLCRPVEETKDGRPCADAQGRIAAAGYIGLKMNVRTADKEKVLAFLKGHPRTALNSPTLAPLSDPNWLAMEIIIEEEIVRNIMPQLYAVSAPPASSSIRSTRSFCN